MSKIVNAMDGNLASAYVSWNNPASFAKASEQLNVGLQKSQPIMRSSAAISNRFQNIDSHTSVRDGVSSLDYAFFRPNEQTPRFFRDIIAACMGAYQKVPVIKQVIDLMGDFTAQGIRLVHQNESIERFYNEWFRKVGGPERSERMSNILYRTGNVIVKRADGRLPEGMAEQWKSTMISTAEIAQADTDLDHENDPMPGKNEVPARYTILNPLILQVLGEHMAAFTGKVHYVLELPMTIYNTLSIPITSFDPTLLTEGLPRDIQQALDSRQRYLLLDSDKLAFMYYKKDDWDVWAYPLLYSLLDEITMLQKMKLADMSALDGVISHIRVWKLGSMEHQIFPTDAAIGKLSSILLNHLAGGAMDLIWGPDLELTETSTDIAKFLGSEKYEFCMNTIHSGLGIPAAIGRSKGTMSDNFMSIRVLLERLKYGRTVLTKFWHWEIRRVQQAMGFRYPAHVMYDNMNLSDEVAEKALWIQLVDRDLVPAEAVQELFGRVPELDNIIMMREKKKRAAEKIPTKVSPYVDPEPELSLKKIALQRGMIGPEQVGLEVPKPSPQEKKMFEATFPKPEPAAPPGSAPKKKGVSGEGRPKNSADKSQRKTRKAKPSSKAEEFMRLTTHGMLAQNAIAQVVDPFFLDKFGRVALKDFTAAEGVELSRFKFDLLMNIDAEEVPYPDTIIAMLDKPLDVYEGSTNLYRSLCEKFMEKKGELTDGDLDMIKSYVYALTKGQD